VRFSPTWTAAEAAAAAAESIDGGLAVERRMRRLFETASALRRRHVYAVARRRGIDRLAWPGLVTTSMNDRRLVDTTVTVPAHQPSPVPASPSYRQVRSALSTLSATSLNTSNSVKRFITTRPREWRKLTINHAVNR